MIVITVAPVKGWDIICSNFMLFSEFHVLEAGKMCRRKYLSDLDKGQIVMAKQLGQSISKMARLVECSQYAAVSTYQWCKVGQLVNQLQVHGRTRLNDAHGE